MNSYFEVLHSPLIRTTIVAVSLSERDSIKARPGAFGSECGVLIGADGYKEYALADPLAESRTLGLLPHTGG